jgi:hypothetical protein
MCLKYGLAVKLPTGCVVATPPTDVEKPYDQTYMDSFLVEKIEIDRC